MSNMTNCLKENKEEFITQIERIIKKSKKGKCYSTISNLGKLHRPQILTYSVAAFAKLDDGGSQGS